MKIELSQLIPLLILGAGVVFGYAQLASKVDSYEKYDDRWSRELTDQNMNRVIALEVELAHLKREVFDQ